MAARRKNASVSAAHFDIPGSPSNRLPLECFAHVGDASKPSTWHLPYRLVDGTIDERRLPKAIQAVLSNYRGARVSTIPEKDIAAVLHRLAEAASTIGRYPPVAGMSAAVYELLANALEQIDRPVHSEKRRHHDSIGGTTFVSCE
ncbi:MAG TPA: hypothetical protein VFC51_18610 [Chloroflexota bacterium]|nr:hypothetical protein [Chloroflexota bacterium]